MKIPVLYIVIPCYNEQEVLPVTSGMFLEKIKSLIEKENQGVLCPVAHAVLVQVAALVHVGEGAAAHGNR